MFGFYIAFLRRPATLYRFLAIALPPSWNERLVWYAIEILSFINVGRRCRRPKWWVESKFWVEKCGLGICYVVGLLIVGLAGCGKGPKGDPGPPGRPVRRVIPALRVRTGPVGPPGPPGAAGRTRPAQSQHSRDTVELPQRRLHGFLSGRRSSCQRLLWAGAQSRHVPRRTAGFMRRRGQRSQCTAGRGMRHGAAITKACSTARADICTPREDCHAKG